MIINEKFKKSSVRDSFTHNKNKTKDSLSIVKQMAIKHKYKSLFLI